MVNSPTAGRFLRDTPVNPHSDKEKKDEEEEKDEEEDVEEGGGVEEAENEEEFLEPTLSTLPLRQPLPTVCPSPNNGEERG